jgi:hypothetical protein
MRFFLLALALVLILAGCGADHARVDAFLVDAGAMPDKDAKAFHVSLRSAEGYGTTGSEILDAFPTRPITYARADALQYARLWVKFGGRPPRPFGFDPRTDAGLLARAEYDRQAQAESAKESP